MKRCDLCLPIGWLVIALSANLSAIVGRAAEVSREDAEQLHVRRIAPLLRDKCLACHGQNPADIAGELDLRSRAGLLQGGESGVSSVKDADPDASPLLLAISRQHADWPAMPPKEADRLTPEQIGWFQSWIRGGTPWPDSKRAAEIQAKNAAIWDKEDGIVVRTAGGLSSDWNQRKYLPAGLWAYRPVVKPVVPEPDAETSQVDERSRPIDALLAARRPEGLTLASPADRATLIRRASFDLTGLPPTPDELTRFLDDPQPDDQAFRDLVERLLASPHYGERMAQHWLDVVRYADSSGFANDYERGNAWRYRDYVVRSFNLDKPYDQFIREQIAGDEIDPANPEMLIAAGFLRMGPWELTGMEVAKIARQRFLDDVTNSVGETFLAHSLQCARCHDHKFDPVPTRDYYAIQAVFATTQQAERAAQFLPSENTRGFEERKYLELRRSEYRETLARLDEQLLESAQAWYRSKGKDATKWNEAVAQVRSQQPTARQPTTRQRDFSDLFNATRNRLMKQGLAEEEFPPKLVGFTPADYGDERVARKGLERLGWEWERYEPVALSVYNGRTPDVKSITAPRRVPENRLEVGELEQTCVLVGGDPFGSGEPVRPGVLSAIPSPFDSQSSPAARSDPSAPKIPSAIEGRRRAFAEWVASPANPLTPRVIANRIWMWHFDRPIAGNPNNFGSTGQRPTHPELLDWLAATFVEEGWSWKAMHRRIMNSAAYRRGAEHPDRDSRTRLDPLGSSYAVFPHRRLTAEELRDAMLTATGELNRELGGIPNRPEINQEVALQPRQVMGTFASAWVPNPRPEQRHRRSLYALKLRGLADPLFEVFNAPAPDFSCERRDASTVTPQVFALLNGQSSQLRSLALARRVLRETSSEEAAVTRAFQLTVSRAPTADEVDLCLRRWREAEKMPEPVATSSPILEIQRQAVEENTGEKFLFRERLHAHADFVPDLLPAELTPRVLAFANVCLAILNSHEFVYVY